jgi:hypothetical protein
VEEVVGAVRAYSPAADDDRLSEEDTRIVCIDPIPQAGERRRIVRGRTP